MSNHVLYIETRGRYFPRSTTWASLILYTETRGRNLYRMVRIWFGLKYVAIVYIKTTFVEGFLWNLFNRLFFQNMFIQLYSLLFIYYFIFRVGVSGGRSHFRAAVVVEHFVIRFLVCFYRDLLFISSSASFCAVCLIFMYEAKNRLVIVFSIVSALYCLTPFSS